MRYRLPVIALASFFVVIPLKAQSPTNPISTIAGGGTETTIAAKATLNPNSVVVDSAGNVYIAAHCFSGCNNKIVKVDGSGMLGLVADDRLETFSGDGGLASDAGLNVPSPIALDSSDNLFIVDRGNFRIRRVDAATRIITTVAGNGTACPTNSTCGDGGLATNAELTPRDVAVDSLGNLFIADGYRVRRVDASTGIITNVAGDGISGSSGDGGPATSALLGLVIGVDVDSLGNLYILSGNTVRRVSASTGIITTVAGGGGYCLPTDPCGDGGPATSASLQNPLAIAVDTSDNLFIADTLHNRVRRVDASTGIITTVAGTGNSDFSGDGGPATAADLAQPGGIALDGSGTLFLIDGLNQRVRRVDASTGVISTFAGGGSDGDGGPATSAVLRTLAGVVADKEGNVYIAGGRSYRVRRVEAATGIIATVAGTGASHPSGDGGPATQANLCVPNDVGLDSQENLFIQNEGDNIRRVDAATGIITSALDAGYSSCLGAWSGGPALPGLAVDDSGNLFFSDDDYNVVRRVDALTGDVSIVAGDPEFQPIRCTPFEDGVYALGVSLCYPLGLALDNAGGLLITDTVHNLVSRLDFTSGIITAVAGDGTSGFSGDGGQATSAKLNYPSDVAVDSEGNLYIADTFNNRVRRVEAATGIITTLAGNGTAGFSGDGGPATSASLNGPTGLAFDSSGNLLISDTDNGRVRKVTFTSGVSQSATQLAFSTLTVGTTSQSQTVILTNFTQAALSFTGIGIAGADSGDFAVAASGTTCSTSVPLTAGTSCKIAVSFTPTAAGSRSGTLTIADNAPASPQTVALSGTGMDFSIAPSSGSVTSATITAGGTANFTLTIAPSGFSGDVSFACAVQPAGPTCSVTPNPLTLDGTNSGTVTVSVATTAPSLAPPVSTGPRWPRLPLRVPVAIWLALAGLLLAVAAGRIYGDVGEGSALPSWFSRARPASECSALPPSVLGMRRGAGGTRPPLHTAMPTKRDRRCTFAWRLAPLAVLLMFVTLWAGCGGGGGTSATTTHTPTGGTAAGTYTITVTGTSGSLSHDTTLTLNVN